jgi:phosphate transport system protein
LWESHQSRILDKPEPGVESFMRSNVRLRLRRKIEKLNDTLLSLGGQVEESVRLAVKAIEKRDPEIATKVIDGDIEIDRREIDLEEECLEILALHQPVAVDLRHIIAALKINKDLERAADLAVNIAESAIHLADDRRIDIPQDYFIMAQKSRGMLKKALDAFVGMTVEQAYQVLSEDDDVDRMKHTLHRRFEQRCRENSENISSLTHLFLVSRHLERVSDLATNIAEEVIYMITGEIVRHGKKNADAVGNGLSRTLGAVK